MITSRPNEPDTLARLREPVGCQQRPAVFPGASITQSEVSPVAQKRQRILCVDYDADVREMLAALLGAAGYDATPVAAPQGAERFVHGEGFDLFILDKVPRLDPGLKLCRELRRRYPHTPIIVYSADVSERHHREVAEAGAAVCVDKPEVRPLIRAVENLIGRECGKRPRPAARSAALQRVVVGGDAVKD